MIFILFSILIGCAAAPVKEEKKILEEPVKVEPINVEPVQEETIQEPPPEIATISAKREGVITKLTGKAYVLDNEGEEFIVLRQGNMVPIGKVFYLEPKTTMAIEQGPIERIYVYSKENEEYFILEIR
jgi:hypothetical protein